MIYDPQISAKLCLMFECDAKLLKDLNFMPLSLSNLGSGEIARLAI